MFEQVKKGEKATVFTSHSIEQLPSAEKFICHIKKYKKKINKIIHFEPLYQMHLKEKNLINLLRRRYTELNDYNKDLWELLKNDKDIEIIESKINVLGFNPLNPTSIVVWQFKK